MLGHLDGVDGDLDATVREAWAAHERLDWDAAIRHWRGSIRLYPGLATAYWMAGALLLDRGNLDEAEAMLDTAVGLDPGNLSLAVRHAQAATARQDWPEAARRWDALLRRAPDDREVIDSHADAVMRSRMLAIDP
jgi:tetratricopeptide (TPR) repeat protein